MRRVMKNNRGDTFLLFKDGREYTHAVVMDRKVYLDRLTSDQEVALTPSLLRGEPYPVAEACRKMLAFGQRKGISMTGRARAVLEGILKDQ